MKFLENKYSAAANDIGKPTHIPRKLISVKPISPNDPGEINGGLLNFTFQKSKTNQANENSGLGSPGWGYVEPEYPEYPESPQVKKNVPITKVNPDYTITGGAASKVETQVAPDSKDVKSKWAYFIGIGLVLIFVVFATYWFAKNKS
jgi:hypothetical protein